MAEILDVLAKADNVEAMPIATERDDTQESENPLTPTRPRIDSIREEYYRLSINNLRAQLYENDFSYYEEYRVDPDELERRKKLFIKSIRK